MVPTRSWKCAVLTAIYCCSLIVRATAAEPLQSEVKIVGIGAANCAEFVRESRANPIVEKHFIAWMQGYMSGIMVGRPSGSDEGIDLMPGSFPLRTQIEFVREYCLPRQNSPFAEAVEVLYRKLRNISSF